MVPGRFVDGTCVVLDFWTFEFLDFSGFLWISPLFCPQTLDYITQQRGWQRRKDEWCKWGPASYFENLAGCFFPHQSHINTAYGGGKRDITCSCVGYCGRLGRAIGRTFRYYCKFQKVTAQEGKGDTRGLSCSFQLQALSSITGKCVITTLFAKRCGCGHVLLHGAFRFQHPRSTPKGRAEGGAISI